MKKGFRIFLICSLILALLLSLCGCVTPNESKPNTLTIVTTSFPPYDFARQIAGGCANVTMLLSPGEEAHTFEPTPQDIITLSKADLFILGGGHSDEWAKKLIASAELDEEKALFMIDCVTPTTETHAEEPQSVHKEHDHSHFFEYDEHVWTSPANAKEISRHICEKLISIDEKNTQVYQNNLNRYLDELSSLDAAFFKVVSGGTKNTLVFADRFPFRHFADHYGLTYFSAFPGCAEQTEPDALTMKFLIEKVKSEAIPVVFYTELSNHKVADAVCEVTGAKKLLFHSCHTVTKDEFARGETYISLMQKNLQALKEALS